MSSTDAPDTDQPDEPMLDPLPDLAASTWYGSENGNLFAYESNFYVLLYERTMDTWDLKTVKLAFPVRSPIVDLPKQYEWDDLPHTLRAYHEGMYEKFVTFIEDMEAMT